MGVDYSKLASVAPGSVAGVIDSSSAGRAYVVDGRIHRPDPGMTASFNKLLRSLGCEPSPVTIPAGSGGAAPDTPETEPAPPAEEVLQEEPEDVPEQVTGRRTRKKKAVKAAEPVPVKAPKVKVDWTVPGFGTISALYSRVLQGDRCVILETTPSDGTVFIPQPTAPGEPPVVYNICIAGILYKAAYTGCTVSDGASKFFVLFTKAL